MISKIIGKLMTYIGFLTCIAEFELRICPECVPNPCPLVLGIGFGVIIVGCIVHEVDEK